MLDNSFIINLNKKNEKMKLIGYKDIVSWDISDEDYIYEQQQKI